jgi:hypothetical protein
MGPSRERPILFSSPMVRALLGGSKTQTRRVVKPEGAHDLFQFRGTTAAAGADEPTGEWGWCGSPRVVTRHIRCPYGKPGDRLWVRETSAAIELPDGLDGVRYSADETFQPIENTSEAADRWLQMNHYAGKRSAKVPAIHMPRWASRIMLEVTGVRVERLQDISASDALAEGIVETHGGFGLPAGEYYHAADPRESYWSLFESINDPGSVAANPWLWVMEFRRL